MTPWGSVQDDFARYARLYGLVSIALLVLNFVDRGFASFDIMQAVLPNVNVLSNVIFALSFYGFSAAAGSIFNIRFLLILVQIGIITVLLFWLLTKFLPIALASLSAWKRPWRAQGSVSIADQPVKQGSPWAVVALMTICLTATFHLVGSLIGQAFLRAGDPSTAKYFFRGYPDMLALFLSAIGIGWAVLRSKGASEYVGRRMGVMLLPADDPLTQRVHGMAAKLNLPPPIVGTMKVMNAFAMGTKPGDAAVVIGQPLLEMLTPEEVDAIIGHELGHVASNDMRRMVVADSYQAIIGGFLGVLMSLPARVFARNRSQAMLAQQFYVLGRCTVAGISELLVKRMSRSREYVADKTGAMLTSPEAMMSALEKVTGSRTRYTPEENKYGYLMFRSGLRGSLLSTHPTFEQRRNSLLNFAEDQGQQEAADAADAPPVIEPRGLSLAVKVMAVVTLVAIGPSLALMEDAFRSAPRVSLSSDVEASSAQASLQELAAQRRKLEADQQRWREERAASQREVADTARRMKEADAKAESAQTALQEVAAKRRQLEAEQQRLKNERDAAEADAARRARDLDAKTAQANAAIAQLQELRRTSPQPQSSYQVANADPAAPAQAPVAAAPRAFPAPLPQPAAVAPTAPAPQSITTACDQLAANPTDQQRLASDGVPFPVLARNANSAVAACEEAVANFPNNRTEKYQLARALYAADRKSTRAAGLFSELVDQKYLAAFDNLGQIAIINGDLPKAVRLFRAGADVGDPDSMISLADLIRGGKVTPRVPNEADYLYDLAASLGHKNAAKDVEERRMKGMAIQTGAAVLRTLLGLSSQ